nr:MAG: hypothetical protein [Bacteriophage sp.]
MSKHDNLHTLFSVLNGCLPPAYNMTLRNDETTIVLTKEGIDDIMFICSDEHHEDDFVAHISYDSSGEIREGEYDTILWTSEDEQIPLSDILSDIRYYL